MANRERTAGTGVRRRAASLTRTMSVPLAHVALALTPGIGRFRFNILIERFGSADAVLSASRKELGEVPGMGPAVTAAVRAVRLDRAKEVMAASKRLESSVLLPHHDDFPAALRNIPDTPVLLFARGDLTLLQKPAVAVVGSRVHTKYGQEACERLTTALAQAGLVVVSGMARGLDALAHWAALNGGGASIGVLGNGHGVVYRLSVDGTSAGPASNRREFPTAQSCHQRACKSHAGRRGAKEFWRADHGGVRLGARQGSHGRPGADNRIPVGWYESIDSDGC